MIKNVVTQLVAAGLGLCIVVVGSRVSPSAGACGEVQAYDLCPGSCDQEHCEDWCQPECTASWGGHSCNGTVCWCHCVSDS